MHFNETDQPQCAAQCLTKARFVLAFTSLNTFPINDPLLGTVWLYLWVDLHSWNIADTPPSMLLPALVSPCCLPHLPYSLSFFTVFLLLRLPSLTVAAFTAWQWANESKISAPGKQLISNHKKNQVPPPVIVAVVHPPRPLPASPWLAWANLIGSG